MKYLIIFLTLTAASSWATPLGDALADCLASSSLTTNQAEPNQVTLKKIPIESEDETALGIYCSASTSEKLYKVLIDNGADYYDMEMKAGTVRSISLGYGLRNGLYSGCHKVLEDNRGKDFKSTTYCILHIDLSPGLISNLDLLTPRKTLKQNK